MRAPRFASLATGLLFVLFGLVLLFAGCVRKAAPLPDGQIYSNSTKNFTLTLPQGWTTSETVAPVGNPNAGTTPTASTGAVDTTVAPAAPGTGTAPAPAATTTTSTAPTATPAPVSTAKAVGDTSAVVTPPSKATTGSTTTGKDGTTAAATTAPVPPFVVVTAVNGKTGGALPETIIVKVEDLPYELSYDEYFLSSLEKMGDNGISAFKEEKRVDFQGNYPGKSIVYSCQKNGVAARGCIYVFMSGKKGCILTGLTPTNAFGDCQKEFDHVAASFAWK